MHFWSVKEWYSIYMYTYTYIHECVCIYLSAILKKFDITWEIVIKANLRWLFMSWVNASRVDPSLSLSGLLLSKGKRVGQKVLRAKSFHSVQLPCHFYIIYCPETEPQALWQEDSDITEVGVDPLWSHFSTRQSRFTFLCCL